MSRANEHKIAQIRQDYLLAQLTEEEVGQDPIPFFQKWLNEAIASQILEPTAMCLSTSERGGWPSSRMVLLKSFTDGVLTFFTNYESKKSQEIDANPKVSLLFFWKELQRQVRIQGYASKSAQETSETYFHSRPIGSQISASISPQSSAIANREFLEQEAENFQKKFSNHQIPYPTFWGGYEVQIENIEFWQGRANRLHDRFFFQKAESEWLRTRLAP